MKAVTCGVAKQSPKVIAWWAFVFPLALYIAWSGAWILEKVLARNCGWIASPAGQAVYWLVAKLLLWVWPATILIHWSGRTLGEVMGLRRLKQILVWGGGFSALLLLINLFGHAVLTHTLLWPRSLDWPLFGGVIVSPIVEEITFRGAVLPGLQQTFNFIWANTFTALLFLGAHLPGWYFQGRLLAMLGNPVGGAVSVFLLGWLFGLVAHESRSVSASILTHMINNLSA